MMDINTLLTLDLAEYTTALEALADQMMLEEPRDIDLMRRRKLDTGREFAVWNFTVGYCMNAADALSLLRAQANENANDGTADLATINNSAARLCDWFSSAFDVTGQKWMTPRQSSPTAATSTPRLRLTNSSRPSPAPPSAIWSSSNFGSTARFPGRLLATSSTATAYARSPARQGNQASSTDNTPPSGSKVRIRGLETHPTASPAPSQSRALFQWL